MWHAKAYHNDQDNGISSSDETSVDNALMEGLDDGKGGSGQDHVPRWFMP
jgi:hypothetical protein